MADINGQTLTSQGSPNVKYYITYTKERINNSTMKYTFTIKTSLGSSQSYLGTGHNLQCSIKVNNGSGSSTLKDRSAVWNGVGPHSTKTITINCTSTTGNSAQTVSFSVTNSYGNAGDYSSSNYTVTSSPLQSITPPTPTYSSCVAPSNFRIVSNYGDYLPPVPENFFEMASNELPSVQLQWYVGSGGANNTLQKYYIQQYILTKAKLPHANEALVEHITTGEWAGYYSYTIRVSSINGVNNENAYNPSPNTTSVDIGLIYEGVGGYYPIPRGARISYRIRSEGSAGSNYYSGYTGTQTAIFINTLPVMTEPTVDKKYIPAQGGVLNFSWSASDKDNQKLTYRYMLYKRTSNGTDMLVSSKNIDTPSFSYSFSEKGQEDVIAYYYRAYTFDGPEGISKQSSLIYYNIPPTISIKSAIPNSGGRTKEISLSYQGNAQNLDQTLTYQINIIYAQNKEELIFNNTGIQANTSLNTMTFTDAALKNMGLIETDYFKCRVRCYDGYDYSNWAEFPQIFQLNKKPAAPTLLEAESSDEREDYGVTPDLTIFENKISLTWDLNTEGNLEGQTIQQIILERATGANSSNLQNWTQAALIAANTNSTTFIDESSVLSNLVRGYYVSYRIKYVDDLGDSSDYYALSTPLKKNTAPTLTGNISFDSSSFTYYPYKVNNLNIKWTTLIDTSDDDYLTRPHKFRLYLTVPGFSEVQIGDYYDLGSKATIIWSDNTNKLAIPFVVDDKLEDFVKNALNNNFYNYNIDYLNVQIRLIAFDSFGISSNSIIGNFNLYLRENPEFLSETYTIFESESNKGLDYYLGNTGSYDLYYPNIEDSQDNPWIPISDIQYKDENKYKMIDSGGIIKFRWKKATDKNGADDISTYTIKMYYSEDVGQLADDVLESQYVTLVNLNRATLEQGHEQVDYYEYEHKVSTVNINRVVKFLIVCTDSTGLQSQSVRFPFGIEICRLVNPSINFNSVEFTENNDQVNLSVSYNIPDYGGSLISSKRGIFYNSRRNLEEDNLSPMIEVTLEYSEYENFPSGNDSSGNPLTGKIIIYSLIDETYPWNTNSNVPQTNTTKILTENIPDNNFNYFARLKITVSNRNGERVYYSNSISLRGLSAPFSFRKIGIGINNKNPESRLHVSARTNDHNIELVIFGDPENLNNQRFVIDLINGSLVSGIIDVGDLE